MLNVTAVDRVYLAQGSVDLQKSIDGLAALVQEGFSLDPFSQILFVFCNRGRGKLKILIGTITASGLIIADSKWGSFTGLPQKAMSL